MRAATTDISLKELHDFRGTRICISLQKPTLLMIIPGVQYAHWNAPASRKACCTGCRRPSFSSPSIVVIGLPAAALTAIWHDLRGTPPISTVQAPHWPSPQPYLLPVRPSSSRSTYNSGVSGSYRTGYFLPLTSISIKFAMIPPGWKKSSAELILVAGLARLFGMIHFMTVQAAVHGRHAGDFRHRFHLRDLPMARFALLARLQMRPMAP